MKRRERAARSLSAQMILNFVALVLVTALAVGIPAVLLIRNQFNHQAWAQVDQAGRAALALYSARHSELEGLATMTAQRPTLQQLLQEQDLTALEAYLQTLQEGSGLDLIAVCNAQGQLLSASGIVNPTGICQHQESKGFHVGSAGTQPQACSFAIHPIGEGVDGSSNTVVVGLALDNEFAAQMEAQTGLHHTLSLGGQPLATSLATPPPAASSDDGPHRTFVQSNHPYYAARFSLNEAGLTAEVALDVTNIEATQARFMLFLILSIGAIVAVASLTGTYLARRIGRPLARVAEAAEAMSQGKLTTPIAFESHVLEVDQVTLALESARSDLQRSVAELRLEKAWTDHLLESIVEGIVTLDRRGQITFFSRGAERIMGLPREEALGQTCDHVFKPLESNLPFSQLIPAPDRRQKVPVELPDGRQAILAVTGARLLPPEGHDARVALVFRDISEEESMHRLMGHFLANVAHEFRTPLSALAASVELLLDQAPDLTPAELAELLTSLHLGVLGLQTLIDNLLESASIEAGRFQVHPRPADLTEIIADAIRTLQPLLDKRGQSLVVQLPASMPMVTADPRRTVQVLINLLSNASKYGPDDAEIELAATSQASLVRVTVSDRGPGVPPEVRESLFRRFMHIGSGNHKAEVGAGLGLSVVRAVVEATGGAVGVDDRLGGGASFWFTLPVHRATDRLASDQGPGHDPAERRLVEEP